MHGVTGALVPRPACTNIPRVRACTSHPTSQRLTNTPRICQQFVEKSCLDSNTADVCVALLMDKVLLESQPHQAPLAAVVAPVVVGKRMHGTRSAKMKHACTLIRIGHLCSHIYTTQVLQHCTASFSRHVLVKTLLYLNVGSLLVCC